MSGFQIITTREGDGKDSPNPGDKVDMHYTGWLYDESKPDKKGKKFDSSVDRGQAFTANIGVGQLIAGWDQGVPQMTRGQKATFIIPPEMGYGARGAGGLIPPNATLLFEVELLNFRSR